MKTLRACQFDRLLQMTHTAVCGRCKLVAIFLVQLFLPPSFGLAQSAPSNGGSPAAPVPGYVLAWSDDFDGSLLDAAKWVYRTDSKHLSMQKPENVSVRDGLLKVVLKKETAGKKDYTGGGIISKPEFKYAYFEARIKMPAGAGWHTSFWLMKHDGSGTTDFQEAAQGIDAGQNDSVDHLSYTVSLNKYNPEPPGCFGYSRLPTPDLSADFHVYGCEFTPEAAKFYLDGKLTHVVDARQIPHGPMNVWISSIASHMGRTPKVDDSALPQETQCDYIRVFTKSPTPSTPDN